jgi:hypothetical protein
MTSDRICLALHRLKIQADCEVAFSLPAVAHIAKRERPILWFSLEQFWEATASKAMQILNMGTREGVAVHGRSTDQHRTHRTGLFVLCSIAGMRFKCLLHLCFSVVFNSLRRFELRFAGLAEAQSMGVSLTIRRLRLMMPLHVFASNSPIYSDFGKR